MCPMKAGFLLCNWDTHYKTCFLSICTCRFQMLALSLFGVVVVICKTLIFACIVKGSNSNWLRNLGRKNLASLHLLAKKIGSLDAQPIVECTHFKCILHIWKFDLFLNLTFKDAMTKYRNHIETWILPLKDNKPK